MEVSVSRTTGVAFLATALLLGANLAGATEPLPSWNNTAAKQAIVGFVEKVTQVNGPDYLPPSERIAVFDNDGTLWAEQPIYFQALFIRDRIQSLAPQHPEWREQEPFAAVLRGDIKRAFAGGEKSLMEVAMATHAGMTTEEFEKIVLDWIATARHPQTARRYTRWFINRCWNCSRTCALTASKRSSCREVALSSCDPGRRVFMGFHPSRS